MYKIFKNGNINIKWDSENTLFSSICTVEDQFIKTLIDAGFSGNDLIDSNEYSDWHVETEYWIYNRRNTQKKYYISYDMIEDFQYCKTVKLIAHDMTDNDFEILKTRNAREYAW